MTESKIKKVKKRRHIICGCKICEKAQKDLIH